MDISFNSGLHLRHRTISQNDELGQVLVQWKGKHLRNPHRNTVPNKFPDFNLENFFFPRVVLFGKSKHSKLITREDCRFIMGGLKEKLKIQL